MPANPFRIQLALQGGGAKIVALLAALEAVNELQKQGDIKVTRIAGTSAGAIAGCLYAAGEDVIPHARTRLSTIRARDVQNVFPPPWPMRVFSTNPLKRPRMLVRLVLGDPLWRTALIEKLLEEVLKKAGNFHFVSDLSGPRGIEVKIIATDLTNSGKVVHEGKVPLIASLMDSCGIPYCFRTWSKSGNPVIVDGGISENLPSEELDSPQDVERFGRVVGISFKRPPKKDIVDPLSFSASLLDASMQNSVERAKARLGDGSVFTIETKLETFDFVDALVKGLEQTGAYGYVYERAKSWFKDFIDRQRGKSKQVFVGNPWATQGIPFMERLGKVYEAQHKNTKYSYEHCSVTVQARCLLGVGDEEYGEPDLVRYRGIFKTLGERVYCHRILVTDAHQETTLERTAWHVTDIKNNREIRAIDLPMRSKESENARARELLLFLDPVLEPNTGPYLFDFQNQIDGFLKPLKDAGVDELVFVPRQAQGKIGKIDLVIWVPRDFPEVILTPQLGVVGSRMEAAELEQYPAPQDYKAFGWTGRDVPPDAPFGIGITRVAA
jgi:predicted acylesterase/phospholipase RssA